MASDAGSHGSTGRSSSTGSNAVEAEQQAQSLRKAFTYDYGLGSLVLKGEDRACEREIECNGEAVCLGMVADGHGGGEAADHCHAHVLDHVQEALAGDGSASALRAACISAFERVHRDLLAAGTEAGCTLTIVGINQSRSEVTCCNPLQPLTPP